MGLDSYVLAAAAGLAASEPGAARAAGQLVGTLLVLAVPTVLIIWAVRRRADRRRAEAGSAMSRTTPERGGDAVWDGQRWQRWDGERWWTWDGRRWETSARSPNSVSGPTEPPPPPPPTSPA